MDFVGLVAVLGAFGIGPGIVYLRSKHKLAEKRLELEAKNGGGALFMCQRSTRKPRGRRSTATGLVLYAYSSEPPSVLVWTKARCAKSLRLSTISR